MKYLCERCLFRKLLGFQVFITIYNSVTPGNIGAATVMVVMLSSVMMGGGGVGT